MSLLTVVINYDVLFFIVNVLAIVNLLILSLFLIVRKDNSLPNYVLAANIFLPITNFTFNLLLLSGFAIKYPKLILFTVSAVNSTFPLLFYIYIRLLTGKSLKKIVVYLPWLVIFMATIVFQWYFLHLSFDEQAKFISMLAQGQPPASFTKINMTFFFVTLVYSIMSIVESRKYFVKNDAKNPIKVLRARFVQTFSGVILLLVILVILFYLTIPYKWVELMVLPISMNIVFFVIVFSAQKSASIFSYEDFKNFQEEANQVDVGEKLQKIKKLYPKIDVEIIHRVLNNEIENKFYLDPNISLTVLSEKHNVSKNHFSTFIKEMYGLNFSEFINKFRVEYAKEIIARQGSEKLSMEGIGLKSGFNSRASFYRAFKKFTSQTPTEYFHNIHRVK